MPDFCNHLGLGPFCTNVADGKRAYSACGEHTSHEAAINGLRLSLQGIKIDKISTLSPIWQRNVHNTAEVKNWVPDRYSNSTYIPTGQPLDEAFRTTILADMDVLRKSRGYVANWHLLDARYDDLTADERDQRNKGGVSLKCASGMRRLCWTKAGRMGLVPATARADDLLYVLFGGQVMYVLREKGAEVFGFVGESYIHGLMDGEIFGSKFVGLRQRERIILE